MSRSCMQALYCLIVFASDLVDRHCFLLLDVDYHQPMVLLGLFCRVLTTQWPLQVSAALQILTPVLTRGRLCLFRPPA